jgi:hypothetical protein
VCTPTDRKQFSEQIYLFTWTKNLLSQPICPLPQKTQDCRDNGKNGWDNIIVGQGNR